MEAMRLSDEKARRLSRLVWRDRGKRVLPLVAAAVVVFAAVAYFTERSVDRMDRTVEVKAVSGTVVSIRRTSAARGTILAVHLGDGRDVDAFTLSRVAPEAGTHVVINEARHASGRSSYEIVHLGD
jgi:hypothetical protein